ncbi:hypothetical protein MASR2M18_21440 [Ignavibacteria bacterium]|nr:DUF2007 domain-containing protein [Bacteroidota bacterium]MCZ2133050.1 DUF2007 domain-containing protein [Bacteroidota bacterium]
MQEETLITVATFDNALQAHIVAVRLQSEGIETYIFNEYMSSILPIGNTVGSAELKVSISDTDHAKAVLREINETANNEAADEFPKT